MTTICDLDPPTAAALRSAVGDAHLLHTLEDLRQHLEADPGETTVVLGPSIDQNGAHRLAETLRVSRPSLGIILVRQRIDTAVLAEALRAGIREVVDARNLSGLNAAVRHWQSVAVAMRERGGASLIDARGPRGRIITVFSAKGGCGKTTLATNLAAALADRGRREVCLVDLDLAFGDVAIALQLFPAHTIADAVPLGDNLDFTAVQALLTPHSPGLTTLVAPVEPGSAESIPATLVAHILELLREHFDYVVVDTPPAFDDQVLAAFDLSDVVALIATLDIPALKNLKLTLETMELLNYPRDRWRIVLNRADSKVGLAIGEVEKTLRAPISVQIPSSRDVPAAINRGVPIVLDDPRHPVTLAIRTFAERYVLNPTAGGRTERPIPAELRNDRRGFLRRRRTHDERPRS
jgi:pilus assembly protein CpaE